MTATSQTFNALDTDLAGTGRLDASFTQREIVRNLNGLTRDHMHPCLSRMFELADTSSLASPHSRRFNAPEGAWTEVVEPCAINVPPGVTQLYVLVRMQVDNGATCYLYPVIDGQQLRGTTDATSSGILTCVGTGSAAHYGGSSATYGGPFTVDVSPSSNPVRRFSMVGQTTKFEVDYYGELDSIRSASFATATGADQTAMTLSTLLTTTLLRRDDYWATMFEQREVAAAQFYDDSAGTYTTVTGLDSSASNAPIFPATMQTDDVLYIAQNTPFDGLRWFLHTDAAYTGAAPEAQFWNGSTWLAMSAWILQATGEPAHNDFTTTKDFYEHDWWDRHATWAARIVNGVGPYHWMRYVLPSVTGFTRTPRLSTLRTLHRRASWFRVMGTEDNETRIKVHAPLPSGARDRGTAAAGTRDVYVVGRAAKAWVNAMHIRPVPLAGIV